MTICARSTAPPPRSEDSVPAEGRELCIIASDAMALSDNDLVRGVLNGRKENLATLCERHYPWVYRFLLANLRDTTAAEDVAQNVFLKMLEKLATFHLDNGNFVGWLFRIAQHSKTDFFRSRTRTLRIMKAEAERLSQATEIDTVLEREARYTQISEYVKRLSPAQQQVIVLRFLADLSVKETAMICGKAEGTIKALQSQALLKLRQLAERSFYLEGLEE